MQTHTHTQTNAGSGTGKPMNPNHKLMLVFQTKLLDGLHCCTIYFKNELTKAKKKIIIIIS